MLVPSLYLIPDAAAANLRRYVEGGGTSLVVAYFSGVADEHARVRLGGYPGRCATCSASRVEEFHPLPPDIAMPLSVPGGGPLRAHTEATRTARGRTCPPGACPDAPECPREGSRPVRERALDPPARRAPSRPGKDPPRTPRRSGASSVHLRGAEALALYTGPYASAAALSGLPAVTRNRYGAGTALYLSTRLTDDAYARLLGLRPALVELVRRGEWLFAVNHGEDEGKVASDLRLPPGGYAVLKVHG